MRGISSLDKDLLASREGLCSKEWRRPPIVECLQQIVYPSHSEPPYMEDVNLPLIFFSPGATTPSGVVFYSPLAGFSLLACEVS